MTRLASIVLVTLLPVQAGSGAGSIPGPVQAAAVDAQDDPADLRRRAATGDARAQLELGQRYEAGVPPFPFDQVEAARWYRRAAESGHAGAQVNLATMYLEGHGVRRDVAQAVTWYRAAAAQGNTMAQLELAMLYDTGAGDLRPDAAVAATWLHRAAARGLAPAQKRLGDLYREGRGVPLDLRAAATWYRRAADQGDADAQTELGRLLAGQTRLADPVEAHKWLNLAASRGAHAAQRARATRLRDELAARMNEGQLLEAYRRAAEWHDTVGAGRP